MWDSSKITGNLSSPSFNIDPGSHVLPIHNSHGRFSRSLSTDSSSDKENQGSPDNLLNLKLFHWEKIDKEYLLAMSKTPLSDLRGGIMRLAKDQHGCRFLQKRIDEHLVPSAQARLANFAIIFEEVENNLYELIIDPFGNYLMQKLIDYCDESILNKFMEALSPNLFQISINQHGTRALQKIIDKLSNDYQLSLLVKGLLNFIIELIKDLNGNHVIQKILNKYSSENCQFIYDSITQDLLVVATHKHGCCVLQKCLNHVNEAQRVKFSNVILKYSNFARLVNDQFGNYVLQYLISTNSIDVNNRLFENIAECGIWGLCTLKFSSNVIEKFLKNCYANEYNDRSKVDLSPPLEDISFSNLKFTAIHCILNSDVNKIANDPYGNYVIQTLIDILIHPQGVYFTESSSGERVILPALGTLLDEYFQSSIDTLQVQIIKKWLYNCLITSPFGKRIQMKINAILGGSAKPVSKVTGKNAWRSSQKQRHIPCHKRPSFDNYDLGSTFDSSSGGEGYQFSELNQSMTNLNMKNAAIEPQSSVFHRDFPKHMNQPFLQRNYMEFKHFDPQNQSRQAIMRNQGQPLTAVNDSNHIHANYSNHAHYTNHTAFGVNVPAAALESKDAIYPRQQYYASMGSSILKNSQPGQVNENAQFLRHYHHQPVTEQYLAFNFNQVPNVGRKQMAGHPKTTGEFVPQKYHQNPLPYKHSTGQVYELAAVGGNVGTPIDQSERRYPSFR